MANPAEQRSEGPDGLPSAADAAAGPGPRTSRPDTAAPAAPVRSRKSWLLPAGLTAAVLVVGLAWWAHNHTTPTEKSQALPPAAGVATVRITVPGTDDGSADAGTGGEAPTSEPTQRATTVPTRGGATATSPAPKAQANTAGSNLALNRPVTASGSEGVPWRPENAVDGNAESRWSSTFSDPQWLSVDLGARWQISEIRLSWETAYATAYRVEVSTDNTAWKSVYSTANGQGGNVTIEVDKLAARYVRVYGTERSGQYGYSLFEVDVR